VCSTLGKKSELIGQIGFSFFMAQALMSVLNGSACGFVLFPVLMPFCFITVNVRVSAPGAFICFVQKLGRGAFTQYEALIRMNTIHFVLFC